MKKYVPRPSNEGERRIVRRSSIIKDVSRGRPHEFVRRSRPGLAAPTVVPRRKRHVPGLSAAGLTAGCVRRVANRTTAAAVLFVAMVAGAGWLWQSPLLEVKHVEVIGAATLGGEQVAAVAGLEGQHMVSVDLGEAQQRVAEHPLVRTVRSERRWPNTVVLFVEERAPWGTWEQAGVDYAIDREGIVLGAYAAPRDRPHIISAEPISLRQGDYVSYQAVDAAAEIYELLPRELGTGVNKVAFVPGKGIQVTTDDGQTALLGDSSSIAYKLAVWVAVRAEAQRSLLTYQTIDLRWGNRPVLQ